VQIDALPGLATLSAKVIDISPTATISSGVVNYQVKVEMESPKQAQTATSTANETIQLRQGLTAIVNIIVQQKTGVLLVPYAAITSQGGQSYVQVVSATGAIEKRAIKTGITDYTNTEVTEGLNEGDKIIISGTTTTKSTATTKTQSSAPMMIPGVGGGGPPR
jgi:HlyD family secretion protein